MPELPEVETIRLGLQKYFVGHTIKQVELRLPKQFHGDPNVVIGGKVEKVRRFGKGLVIDLDNGYSLAIHVKMTGQLIFSKLPVVIGKHTHIIFYLDNNEALLYNDMRQFGWIHVVKAAAVPEMPFFKSLGKEPLKDLTYKIFVGLLKTSKKQIKVFLMDQTKIAGIGNIYANDALYRARIDPRRSASSLSQQEGERLFSAIEAVLKKGIAAGGASEWHYVDVLGGKGKYQNFFLVYQKDGKPCQRCGTIIEKIILGGRGTFFCPNCQS
ncbi:MAG TPA: bifunctional DNA-formamidopyrimidine glycosylase/DNA-(apurinic or apyrimidinic site) lyase [Methylomirabilota bacterium]|nr:bifunctional DNA-formamidopyrimidine glycosylase/DNA-(apurinic or apyrimidinic site) lyase [Methylomirabilota bacterium]